ncbi:YbaN family protein [Pusillimonas sp. SM2304]|uniref:YbaN family protein n=1 Tax=Pusillimonas sp. SM2304 TaxID=3073241 RepID=UPI0038F7236E
MIKILFNFAGTLALLLAILGIFLPLLPTTPFLLLASACYLRGSDRLHRWLLANRVFGPYLANLQAGRGIPLRSKIIALTVMWASLAFSAWYVPIAWLRPLLLIPGIGVTVYLLRMKTLPPQQALDNRSRREPPG